ncbi:hypothetical protein V8G54_024701 [Vigna mungo]|uniref:GAG-pre-integrase domain-containing protein n=1 Tax=Vigna mungo TaxID=3915 RepID=A0AAQ3N7K2_VIGMU
MEAILGFQELDEIVKKGFQEPSKGDSKEMKKLYKEKRQLDYKGRMLLHQCISAIIFQKVSKVVTAKEVWGILQEGYGNSRKVKKIRLQALERQYELLCMGKQETIVKYIWRIQIVVNVMRACDKVVKDKKIVDKILRTLTPQYDHIIVAIEECKDLETMRVEELQNSLEAHEQRLIQKECTKGCGARNNQSFKSCGAGKGQREITREVEDNKEAMAKRVLTRETFNVAHATSLGITLQSAGTTKLQRKSRMMRQRILLKTHVEEDLCRELVRNRCDRVAEHVLQSNATSHVDKCHCDIDHMSSNKMCHVAVDEESECVLLSSENNHAVDELCWYLVTGCSNRMIERREWLVNLDPSIRSNVRFIDDSTVTEEGIDRVLITCKNGRVTYMDVVLYVPTMKSNLLSLGQLLEKGYTMTMQQNLIKVFDRRQRLVIKAPFAKNRTLKVNLNAAAIQCLSTSNVEEKNWVWHYKFGHLNFKRLSLLNNKELIKGVPLINTPKKICEGCAIGKQARRKFKKSAPKRAKQPLDVVHSNICGPFEVSSLGGNKYFLIFVDERTRKIWIYLLKEKKEIKIFRTNGRGEFKFGEMSKFCDDKGIVHEVVLQMAFKGLVIERIQDSISEEVKRLIYLRDGSGEYCPSLRLKEKDFMMPRKNPSLLKAETHGWSDGEELEQILLHLIHKVSMEQNSPLISSFCKLQTLSVTTHEALPKALPIRP